MMTVNRAWDAGKHQDQGLLIRKLVKQAELSAAERAQIVARATSLIKDIRQSVHPSLMDVFLGEYGLSTDEGVALMCLAEALLRVPDAPTIDALIEDKIAPSDWSRHLGQSASPLVNASTWGLYLTGRVLDDGSAKVAGHLRSLIRRLGEPVIRTAIARAMREMGRQFVLGQTIDDAMTRAAETEAHGYCYSYDMLGEAAMTADDAARYAAAYAEAIDAIATRCAHETPARNPGISIKLSALHPRFELAQTERVEKELVPILTGLARRAARAGMGLNIDAEEMDRLALSMHVMERVLADQHLKHWDGFGVVVQAYGRRAGPVIDRLHDIAERLDRRIMVRLVKGAYWDTEIKHAQVQGLADFPVFTRKAATDISYIAHARRLLQLTDRIYPQFATHNAHSVSAILHMAHDLNIDAFEFQRLHGMGEALHDRVMATHGTRCRIYAPVGAHRDLLAYLVRRLLENGANSSFVNQIVDDNVAPAIVAACPFDTLLDTAALGRGDIPKGTDLYAPKRLNSKGLDLSDTAVLDDIDLHRIRPASMCVQPILAVPTSGSEVFPLVNPATDTPFGTVLHASTSDAKSALDAAKPWNASSEARAAILNRAADLYEKDLGNILAVLATEAGKTMADAVAELREAVDFLRYYASGISDLTGAPRGRITCISPWNFPLAIFTGQIAAALAAGNAVLAKPAEATPAIAFKAVQHLHAAGVPKNALQLLPGIGGDVGAALTSDMRVDAVAFTGSTQTARRIQRNMANHCRPGTPLIAETGGLNAMVVDSTALPEQAVRDIVASAFQSAGQRCSALRCLYVQADIALAFRQMLIGAMDQLQVGDPWDLSTDVGPVIDAAAQAAIDAEVTRAQRDGRLVHELAKPKRGTFVAPALIQVSGIEDLTHEVFGPVLHIATFEAGTLPAVLQAVNQTGYGLTFGVHTRIDARVQSIADKIKAGNIYANRNQIGAVVGSQPFGGEGLSGTGPKAGGPHYLPRFRQQPVEPANAPEGPATDLQALQSRLDTLKPLQRPVSITMLPGPTGELNQLKTIPRDPILCLGPGPDAVAQQIQAVEGLGGQALGVADRLIARDLTDLGPIGGVMWWGAADAGRAYARALADRDGPIVPLITERPDTAHVLLERHLCVDTTAAGGNTALLNSTGQ